MKFNAPAFIALRVILYSLLMLGIAEVIFFDAANPWQGHFFSENSFTEIGQEIIFFLLFVFFLVMGIKWFEIRPFAYVASLFFLFSFIREFNFFIADWQYPAGVVAVVALWVIFRYSKSILPSAKVFFGIPPSVWFFSGFLVTYIFSRLIGRSKFWQLMYHDGTYRLAKAATEEGIELLGDTLMLIGAVELLLWFLEKKRSTSATQ